MPQQKTNIETAIMPFKVQQLVEIIMHKKQLDYEEEKKTKMQDNPKILLFFSFCLEKYKDFVPLPMTYLYNTLIFNDNTSSIFI